MQRHVRRELAVDEPAVAPQDVIEDLVRDSWVPPEQRVARRA
jgi:hypothetical protein